MNDTCGTVDVCLEHCSGAAKRVGPRLREFCRQGKAEVVSRSRNKILQTLGQLFWRPLYICRSEIKIELLLVLNSLSRLVHCPVLPETVSNSSAAADMALFSGIPDDALGSKKEFEGSMGAGSGGEWWWASRKGSSTPPRQSSTMQSIIGFKVRNEQKISRVLRSEITDLM